MRPTMSVYHLEVLGVADLTNASAPDLPWDTPNIADVHGVFLPPDTADGLSFISAPALAVNTLDIATGVTATNTNPVILPEGIGSGLVVDWGGPFRGAADGLPGRLVSTAHARILEFPVAMTQEFESKALLVGDFLPAKCVAREGIG